MSNLVTIISKFYDASGKVFPDLQVKSRYKGSTRENSKKTNDDGLFVFQASPNRIVEILAKLPSLKKYQVFKIINTSIQSSLNSPIIINLPKQGLVTTVFKVVDSQGKEMANFPVQTRPKGGKKFDRLTDNKGFLEVQSSPNREIEFLVLNVRDDFILKKSLNSMNGTQEPILIKLEEPFKNFISNSKIELLDRDGNDYIIEKTKVEILNINTGEKIIYSTSNGKIPVRSMVGEKLQFTVLKPDGKPLNSVFYTAKRINEKPIKLHLDVDIIKGRTVEGEPSIEKKIDEKILITMEQMQKMWPGVSSEKMQPIMDELNKNLQSYKLDTRLRQAHFFGQVFGEIGGKFTLREDISNYTAKNLIAFSSYYKKRPKEAEKDAKLLPKELKIKTITNKWYMDKNRSENLRLGNIYEGDGYKFLGRGLKQTTGRYNYSVLTKMYPKVWPNDGNPNFIEAPQLLEQSKYAVRSAIIFWLDKKLYNIADNGEDVSHVDKITRVINLYAPNKEQRKLYFKKSRRIFI